jgi:F0F1-type ATP synthase assembly protein I
MSFGDWTSSTMALRLHNRRWYPLIFFIGFATVIASWLCFPAVHQPELLVSALGGVTGFTYFLYRQHLDEAKLFKELYSRA